jgi:hypothetical protein
MRTRRQQGEPSATPPLRCSPLPFPLLPSPAAPPAPHAPSPPPHTPLPNPRPPPPRALPPPGHRGRPRRDGQRGPVLDRLVPPARHGRPAPLSAPRGLRRALPPRPALPLGAGAVQLTLVAAPTAAVPRGEKEAAHAHPPASTAPHTHAASRHMPNHITAPRARAFSAHSLPNVRACAGAIISPRSGRWPPSRDERRGLSPPLTPSPTQPHHDAWPPLGRITPRHD